MQPTKTLGLLFQNLFFETQNKQCTLGEKIISYIIKKDQRKKYNQEIFEFF